MLPKIDTSRFRCLAPMARTTVPLVLFVAFNIVLFVAAAVVFAEQRAVVQHSAGERLRVTAEVKAEAISNWARERRSDLHALVAHLEIDRELQSWLADGAPDDARRAHIRQRLRTLNVYGDYRDAILADPRGAVLLSANGTTATLDPRSAELVRRAAATQQPQFSDAFALAARPAMSEIDICEPIPLAGAGSGGGGASATLLLMIDPDIALFPFMGWWPGPSGSAESNIVFRQGNDVVWVNRPRIVAATPQIFRRPLGSDLLAAAAAGGAEGLMAGRDYRGVPVLAAIAGIRQTPWHLVVKLDTSEIEAPIRRLEAVVTTVVLLLSLSIGALMVATRRRQQANDIADSIRAEQQAATNAAVLAAEHELSPDGILVVDTKGQWVSFNQRFVDMWGLPDDIVKRKAEAETLEIATAKVVDPAGFAARIAYLYEHRHETSHEEFALKDGRIVERHSAPLLLANGEIDGRLWFFRDVTALRHASVAESQLAAIVNSSADAILSTDLNGLLTTWNAAAERLYGYSAAEMLGHTLDILVPAEHWAEVVRYRQSIVEDGQTAEYESARTSKTGARIDVSVMLSPVRAADGRVIAISAIIRDITARKQGERQLARSRKALLALSRTNAELVRATSEASLYERMCQAIVEVGGYRMAWIGLARNDPEKSVRPVAYAGFEDGYLRHARVSWGGNKYAGGPTGTAIRQGTVQINHETAADPRMEPWRGEAQARGYRSSIALPLHDGAKVFGALTIYSNETDAFETEEVDLLQELADDLAFGILAVRNREESYRLASIVESSRDAIIGKSLDGIVTSWNSAAQTMYGFRPEEAIGQSIQILIPDSLHAEMEMILAQVKRGEPVKLMETERRRKDGTLLPVSIVVSPIYNRAGEVIGASSIARDITEQKRIEQELQQRAHSDALTGLPNRVSFVDALQRTIAQARRSRRSCAVLYLDLDHFKDVNDTLGHPAGDKLLQMVAVRLRDTVRLTDTVARFGGDEFAVIAADIAEPADSAVLAQRLLDALNQPIALGDSDVHMGLSIGIAVLNGDAPDPETLLSRADIALYRAKSSGRGTYRFFTPSMDEEVHARFTLANELRTAIDTGHLFLLYQPQVDAGTGRIIGLEALVRWTHPRLGAIPPSTFIPVAEQVGLAVSLGHWVIEEACRQTREWLDAGIEPPVVAVNLSGHQFRQPRLLEADINAALAAADLTPARIELELTESVLMEASRENNDVLTSLRQSGFGVAIDDFGTGYSSLDYLRRFPTDRIKIAQVFVKDVTVNPGNAAIVRATIGLAQELDLRIIAEGVETRDQFELLKSWGCREMQGYYFARPLLAAEIAALLRAGRTLPLTTPPVPATPHAPMPVGGPARPAPAA